MDPVKMIEGLKGASPWLIGVTALLVALAMILYYKRKRQERNDIDELRCITVALHDDCEEAKEMLAAHCAMADVTNNAFKESVALQTQLLTKIANELISMNAIVSGRELTIETSKVIIQTQWESCREETVRLIVNSIHNNHFSGNEKFIARKVARVWKQAADKASSTVGAHDGLSYPYRPLFELHIKRAWSSGWGWALPIYYKEMLNKTDAIEELSARMRSLFDEILRSYFSVIEDIDKGTLYAAPLSSPIAESKSGLRTISEAQLPIADAAAEGAEDMLLALQRYKPGEASGAYSAQTVRQDVVKDYESRIPLHESPVPKSRSAKESSFEGLPVVRRSVPRG